MSGSTWFDFLFADHSLYLWGSYLVGLALVAIEIVLLVIRERTIRGHLGWTGLDPARSAATNPQAEAAQGCDRP
jgi:heme exporter protein D